jgi:hypothetical protein
VPGVSGRGGTASGGGSGAGAAATGVTIPGVRRGTSFLTRSFVRCQIPERRGGAAGAACATFGPASISAGRAFGRSHPQPPTPASVFPSIQF